MAVPPDMAFQKVGIEWRDEVLKYHMAPSNNPHGLLPAWQLYQNRTYKMLKNRYGLEHLYILSAGWGRITADFLTPAYNITFSISADAYKRRRKTDCYDDLRRLPADSEEPVVFFVSKAYISLACKLTEAINGPKYLFYNAEEVPETPGCHLIKFVTRTRTNWQYECA